MKVYSLHSEALKHIQYMQGNSTSMHTQVRGSNREQTNTPRVLQGIISAGEPLFIFHMRIKENQH